MKYDSYGRFSCLNTSEICKEPACNASPVCLPYVRIIADKTGKIHAVQPLSPAIFSNFGCL